MSYIATNLLPILAATVVGLLIGALYGRVFRPGDGPRPSGSPWGLLVLAATAEFWLACILAGALILAPHQGSPWTMAIGSAVVIWIGFVLPTLVVSYVFRTRTAAMAVGDVLHWLVVMVAQAAVLQAIGLVHP